MREGHDRRDDGAPVLVPGHVGDEGAVDLHLVHREALQVGEARVAGAEIVEGDRHAERLQLVERAQRDVGVLHRGGLGDLELEQLRRQTGVPERLGDELHQPGVVELARREVHRHLQAMLRADERRPAAGFAQHPFADLQDEARLLRHLDEFRRADQTAMRVVPAHQGLVRHDLAALRLDDRLVVHAQLVAAERAPQVALERQAPRRRQVHLLGEELVVGAAHLLRVVHGRVGVADQRLGVAAVVGKHADADGGRDHQFALLDEHGIRQLLDHLLRHAGDIRGALDLGQHHHELVAADAADGVADAQLLHQALRHFLEQRVAHAVAERVVDVLEAVEVDEHHRGLLPVAVAQGERLAEPVLQQPAVGKPGERIMGGQVLGAAFRILQLGGALGHLALEGVQGLLHASLGFALGRDILEAPDPLLLLASRVDAPAAGAAVENGAVAALEFPFAVVRLAGGGGAIGEQARLAPCLLRGEQHRGALADELAGACADHVLQETVAALDRPVAHEGDADRGVVEDQLLLGGRAPHALVGLVRMRDVLEQPDLALGRIARLDRAAGDAAPESRAVLAAQPLLARVGVPLVELLVDLVAPLELLLGEVQLARRAADRGAGGEAEQLFEAAVAAHSLAIAGERDADHHVVEQRLLLGEHPLQLVLGAPLLGDVLDDPHRAAVRVPGVDRAPVGARPEAAAVLAATQFDAARGLAARQVDIGLGRFCVIGEIGIQHRGRLPVELAGPVAVHFLVAAVAAHDAAFLDEQDADRRGAQDGLLLAQQPRHLVGVAALVGDVLDDPDRAALRVPGVERLGDHAAHERRAVLAPQLPFQVELPARGKDRHRDLAERVVALAAGVHHLAGLADQLVRPPAEHLGEPLVAQKDAPLASEGDADGDVGEQRLVFELRMPGAPGIALPRRLERGLDAARGGVVHRGGGSGTARRARIAKSSA